MGIKRLKTVVSSGPTASLDLDLSGKKIEIVMENEDMFGFKLKESCGGDNRLAGKIHKRLGLEKIKPLGGSKKPVTFLFPRRTSVMSSDCVNSHEPNIVASSGIILAGITETNDQIGRSSHRKKQNKRSNKERTASNL